MKLKKYNDFVNEEILGSGSRFKLPTEEEIADELRKLFKESKFDKTNKMEEKIEQLLQLYKEWDEDDKQSYDAGELARKLLQYM